MSGGLTAVKQSCTRVASAIGSQVESATKETRNLTSRAKVAATTALEHASAGLLTVGVGVGVAYVATPLVIGVFTAAAKIIVPVALTALIVRYGYEKALNFVRSPSKFTMPLAVSINFVRTNQSTLKLPLPSAPPA